jgi:hypothetical protein
MTGTNNVYIYENKMARFIRISSIMIKRNRVIFNLLVSWISICAKILKRELNIYLLILAVVHCYFLFNKIL